MRNLGRVLMQVMLGVVAGFSVFLALIVAVVFAAAPYLIVAAGLIWMWRNL